MTTEALDVSGPGTPSESTAEHLSQFGVDPKLAALITAAGEHHRILSQLVTGQYVSVAPFGGGYVAAYVAQNELSLALPPPQAKAVSVEEGWHLEAGSGITSYVHIPAAALASESGRSVALQLLLESLDWRALSSGQGWKGAAPASAQAAAVPVCPLHFTQMLGGHCDDCD